MIEVNAITKLYDRSKDEKPALDNLTMTIKKGGIYGLIGVNGSGKTTALKAITGVIRTDSGEVVIDGAPAYENIELKRRLGYVPDDLYFMGSYNLRESAAFYKNLFPKWDGSRFTAMTAQFGLPDTKKITRFSKGMQKQAAFILTMCASPDYLILDEPIDGLDPIIRKFVWKYIVDDVAARDMTVLVSSHNLREMEGICDTIGIIDNGRMLLERELDELRGDIQKIQTAFPEGVDYDPAHDNTPGMIILKHEKHGSIYNIIARGQRELVKAHFQSMNPLVLDLLPLTLEEVFIFELGGDKLGSLVF